MKEGREVFEWITFQGLVITQLDTNLVSAIIGMYFGGSLVRKIMNSNQWMDILETVGIPAAFAVAAGWMVYKLFNALIADIHKKLRYPTWNDSCIDR